MKRDKKDKDPSFSHITSTGAMRMVDIHAKSVSWREARATASVYMSEALFLRLRRGDSIPKGDVWAAVRFAAVAAAKRTAELIPLCHPLALESITLDIDFDDTAYCVRLIAECGLWGRTGAEMEALTAVSIAALTLYDMCKAVDKAMKIGDIMLLAKKGGASGEYQRDP